MHDVVVVGHGPVGQTAAALLGQQGLDVAVFERFSQPYGLPRAIRFDHEIMRMWQGLGIADELLEDIVPVNRYEWFGSDGELILRLGWPDGPSGWPFSYVFFQPYLEAALNRASDCPNVELNRGWTLSDLIEHEDHVDLEFRRTRDVLEQFGEPPVRRVSAKYVIGADGARSATRDLLQIELEDLGFNERWFVVDVRPTDTELQVPDFPQQFCDPRRPHMWCPNGRQHRRWEFMLLPGEEAKDFDDPQRVWDMLKPWITADQGELVRQAVYEFECKMAASMRSGRCFLAGDAAHLMPPHLGEGLCSGLRDANSLAWRLGLVLRGAANERLLDSYSSERAPHVRVLVEQSLAMGRVSCVLDPEAAAARDQGMRAAGGAPPLAWPSLGPGLAYVGFGCLDSLNGQLSVQGTVELDGRSGRLDDVLGSGFKLIVDGSLPGDLLSAAEVDALDALGCQVVALGDNAADVDGALGGWLRGAGAAAVIVRPDFYVFGGVASLEDVPRMVDDLVAQVVPNQAAR